MWEAVSTQMSGSVDFQRVNVDNKDDSTYQQFANQARSIPAIVWIDGDGKQVSRTGGYKDADGFRKAISSILGM